MKAHVYVTLKKTVLDPQGQAIHKALRKMRHPSRSRNLIEFMDS